MFGLFRKKTEKENWRRVTTNSLKEVYDLSHTNRADSDKIAAEAAELLKRIDSL